MAPVGALSTAEELFDLVREYPDAFTTEERYVINRAEYLDGDMQELMSLQDDVDLQRPGIREPLSAHLEKKLSSARY